ncbi:MAG: lipopolysaccharide transport periplasmic protein LptA [Betaproteobacteria bacterium RBG_16_64_9]|nr:MAG: lipopolysaccharide transport periplasmic protein LptA [Betaproteobacteria bacterium RBG_16_64_9]
MLLAWLPSIGALAERADRDKPLNVESDRMTAEETKRTAVFEGRVILTQGTLTIRAERLVVRQDPDGFQHAVATGKPAFFRQKRDGANEYIEGEAERMEYDGKSDASSSSREPACAATRATTCGATTFHTTCAPSFLRFNRRRTARQRTRTPGCGR